MSLDMHVGAATTKIAKALIRKPRLVEISFVRPTNTTAYAIGDAIYPAPPADPDGSGPQTAPPQAKGLKLEAASSDSGTALILNARLIDFAAEATRLSVDLLLFSAELTAAPVDNEPFSPTAADMENYVGMISFPNSIVSTVGSFSIYEPVPNRVIRTALDSPNIYAVPVARNAYTPTSGERLIFQLGLLPQDLSLF